MIVISVFLVLLRSVLFLIRIGLRISLEMVKRGASIGVKAGKKVKNKLPSGRGGNPSETEGVLVKLLEFITLISFIVRVIFDVMIVLLIVFLIIAFLLIVVAAITAIGLLDIIDKTKDVKDTAETAMEVVSICKLVI